MDVVTSWVKPKPAPGGRDLLGTQTPCLNIYAQLLPGITNVTDRARYYTFYPWFIWAFHKKYPQKGLDHFTEFFRRGECLFTLIAEDHGHESGKPNSTQHGVGLTGRNALTGQGDLGGALRDLRDGEKVHLSDYATQSSGGKRYFKTKLGGLGQYYAGVLGALGLTGNSDQSGSLYTSDLGSRAGEVMDKYVDTDGFFETLEQDLIGSEELRNLVKFCPCHLPANTDEREFIIDVFIGDLSADEEIQAWRRETLGFLLELIDKLSGQNSPLDQDSFRGCAYSGHLPSGQAIDPSEAFVKISGGWAVYQRNDLFSVALQGLFAASLALIESNAELLKFFRNSTEFASWLRDSSDLRQALGPDRDRPFTDLVADVRSNAPDVSDWLEEEHEVQLARAVVGMFQNIPNKDWQGGERPNPAELIRKSINLLIILAGRGPDSSPYEPMHFPASYFDQLPANLAEFARHRKLTWSKLSLSEVVSWIAVRWGIELHIKVALRRHISGNPNPFVIIHDDARRALAVSSVPWPGFTNPRFRQAIQMLDDLGAFEEGEDGSFELTHIGQRMLERAREL